MLTRRMFFMILAASTVVLAPIVAAHAGPWRTPGMQPAAVPRLGPEVQISVPQYPECHRYQSDVAFNWIHDEYLVVWVRSLTNIYGARLNWDGTVARSDFVIYSGSTTQQNPAVTTNEQNRYVVAWEHQYSATDWDILGIELNVDGDQVAPFFAIAPTGEVEARPDVAANGATKEWLAVWQRTAEAGDAIWAAAWKSGAVPGKCVPVAAVTFWNNRYLAVAADIPGYLIVYEGRAADPTQYQHIYGRMWWPEAVYLPLIIRNG